MGPISEKEIKDVRLENVKKRMELERLNEVEVTGQNSDSENANIDPVSKVIEKNYKRAMKASSKRRERNSSEDDSSLLRREDQ